MMHGTDLQLRLTNGKYETIGVMAAWTVAVLTKCMLIIGDKSDEFPDSLKDSTGREEFKTIRDLGLAGF